MNGLIQLLNNLGLSETLVVRATFYPLAGLTVLAALCAVTSRNLFHSALYLAVVLIGVAGVYLFLEAPFLAMVQVLIYVGAVVTLFIFAIMLTADLQKKMASQRSLRSTAAALAALSVLAILVRAFLKDPWLEKPSGASPLDLPELGRSLMTHYVLPFEILSVLLLAVLVGAVVIGKAGPK